MNTTGVLFGDLFDLVTTGLNGLSDLAGAVAFNIRDDFAKSNQETTTGFGVFFKDTEKGFAGLLHGISRIVASATGVLGGFFAWLGVKTNNALLHIDNAFIGLGNSIGSVFFNTANAVMDFITLALNKTNAMIGSLNQMLANLPFGSFQIASLNLDLGGRFQFKPMSYKTTSTTSLSQFVGDYVGMAVGIADSTAGSYLKSVGERVNAINATKSNDVDLSKVGQTQRSSSSDKDKDKDKNGNKKSNKDNIKPLKVNDTVLAHAKKYDYAGLEREFNLPSGVLASVEMQESGGNAYARSPAGALGAFQFMPNTAKEYGIFGKEHDVAASARAAAQYLSKLQKQFGSLELALAAYNAGPGNVKKYGNVIPPFKETKNYVKNIKGRLKYLNGGMDGNTNISQIIDNENKNDHRAQQAQQDTLMMFLPKGDRDAQEFKELVGNIRKTYAHNDALREELLNEAKFSYENQVKYNETDFELKTRGHEMTALQKAQKEYELGYYDVMSRKDLTREQKGELIKPLAAELQDKVNANEIRELESNLELNGWRMNFTERIKLEKSLAQTRLALEKNIVGDQKTAWEQAIEERYQFLEQKHATEQSEKVKEIDKLNEAARKGGHYASLLDFMAKNQWSKFTYDEWALKNTHDTQLSEEEERYDAFKKQINTQDDNGNYVIESEKERHRLLENALIVHEQTKHAIKERYAQESEQLEKERFRHSVQAYGAAFGEMSNLIKAFGGEQSKSYRAMFAVSKAFALADIGINMGKAISQAWGDPSATTIWQKMANVAKVTLAEGYLMQMVNAVTPKGFATGGYTGNIGTSQIAGVVHGQEYVLNAKATKRIGRNTLDRLNSGEAVGGQVNVIINNYSNEKATVEQQPNGDLLVVVGAVAQGVARAEINKFVRQESRQGGLFNK